MSDPRDLLVGLLDYIKEQAKQIDPSVYRLSSSKGFIKQRADLSGLPGVEFDIRLKGDHIWLRVPRLQADTPPDVGKGFKSIIRVSNDPDGAAPFLDEAAFKRLVNRSFDAARDRGGLNQDANVFEAQQRSVAVQALASYHALWTGWAAGERPRRRTIALYGDLFSLKHQIEAEQTGKPQELVWGIGIATWQLAQDKKPVPFEYPMLTQVMEIAIDSQSLALDLRPRATDTQVEMDAFIACQISEAIEVEKAVENQLGKQKETPVTPFDPGSYTPALKLVAGNLDSEGSFREVLAREQPVPVPGDNLVVTDAWVIFSRPRAVNFLFEDLKRLQEKLDEGCTLHDGPLALVTPPSDEPIDFVTINFRGLSSRGTGGDGQAAKELYFPLPYNEEQVTIVQRLEHAPGVTVQGPPGTGKTHTIANIICHYLATGKRVLVTSRGEQALSVLQEKIPEDVRALTVALLTSDREGIRQFQGSIEAIQHRVTQTNPEMLRQEIERLQTSIQRAHSELLVIDRKVDAIAMAQLADVEMDGQKLRAQDLAELVVAGESRYQWFDDVLTLASEHAPPLSANEVGRLRESRRKLGQDLVYVNAKVPSAESLPSPAAIGELHDVLVKRELYAGLIREGGILPLKSNAEQSAEAIRQLHKVAGEILECVTVLEEIGDPWPFVLRVRCGQASYAAERSALEALFEELEALKHARAEFLKYPISFPESGLEDQRTRDAVTRAAETGKPFGMMALGAAEAKEHIAAVKISGRPPASREDWRKVNDWLRLHERILVFSTRWNEVHELLSIPAIKGGVTALRTLELTGSAARRAHYLGTDLDVRFRRYLRDVFEPSASSALDTSRASLERIKDALDRHLNNASLANAAMRLADLQEKLAGASGPVSDLFRAFIDDTLGNAKLSRERVGADYAEIVAELRRIAGLASEIGFVDEAAERIEQAGASRLAKRMRTVPVGPSGEDSVFPTTWRDAWNWARMRSHLESIESRHELLALSAKRREVEGGLARFYQEMVAKSAWLATKRNATPRILQALAGYATAVRRIGQGTGPNAIRYRRDAREAMYEAVGAVPCWIMNHSRISESMPADVGSFDLVIVDEASQSDLWALPAILRGKKILVVGDDKQVSPDGGFVDSTRIQELRDRFLTKQPYAADMTPEKSLYDLAARVFAANQVMLREHFRCVPPIIAYSNRVFYQNQILPLRIPRASERIEPPLVDLYVEGGYRDAHDRNDCEAQAISEEICAILKDGRFAGRTLGVVSLLGSEQAKHIDSIVRQRCDSAELLRRKFLSGDARAFQGSERHIMFISLVADPADCKALSGNVFDQRFNVAASRAQDRMYLVRSVTASDLSDKDLRMSLLSHFDKPVVANAEDVEHLIDLCESGFEQEVYTELVKRGYRVIPQVKTGAYRIDMVVEGAGDIRLAIECDGDQYHGPDRWSQDMNRQRILERAGWVFWRCFASTWVSHKDEVLGELIQRMYAMGIEPVGALQRSSKLVEKRVWRQPQRKGQNRPRLLYSRTKVRECLPKTSAYALAASVCSTSSSELALRSSCEEKSLGSISMVSGSWASVPLPAPSCFSVRDFATMKRSKPGMAALYAPTVDFSFWPIVAMFSAKRATSP